MRGARGRWVRRARMHLPCGLSPSFRRAPLPTRTLPAVVVFDLDWTLWRRPRFRVGPPWTAIDDGRGGIRSACGEVVTVFDGSREALLRLADAGVPVSVASRTHRQQWALDWMTMLRLDDTRTLADVIGQSPVVLRDGPKSLHLREIAARTSVPFDRMLYFDDSYSDLLHAEELGVMAVHCPASHGVARDLFCEALQRFAENGATRHAAHGRLQHRNSASRRQRRRSQRGAG